MNLNVVSYPHDRITCSAATMLNEALDGYGVKYVAGFSDLPADAKGAIIVFHGQQEAPKPNIASRINWFAKMLDWVIWISLGDENCDFPYGELDHKNAKLWVQTPKPGKVRADRYLIEGYHPYTHSMLRLGDVGTRLDWFFAGQVNHDRRKECINALGNIPHGILVATGGFMQGMPTEEFYRYMKRAKIVPCPAGPSTPDSFRFSEALESGAIPILDAYSPDKIPGYWDMVLGDHPFHVIEDWSTLPFVMAELLSRYEEKQRLTQYFWKRYKLAMRTLWLSEDLVALGAV